MDNTTVQSQANPTLTSAVLRTKTNPLNPCFRLSVSATVIAVLLGFPLKAKAEWYVVGHDEREAPIYMNDESVRIKEHLRSAEVRHEAFGRAIFIVDCTTSDYYIQSNNGNREGYAEPGTVAGVIADEICDNYNPK